MKRSESMPIFLQHYETETTHLDTEQHGAYVLLQIACWRRGGWLPNDPKKLARIAGVSLSRWASIGTDVLNLFINVGGGQLVHPLLQPELARKRELSAKRARSAALGGHAKSLKTKSPQVPNGSALGSTNGTQNTNVVVGRFQVTRPREADASRVAETFSDLAARHGWIPLGQISNDQRGKLRHRVIESGGLEQFLNIIRWAAPNLRAVDFEWIVTKRNFNALRQDYLISMKKSG